MFLNKLHPRTQCSFIKMNSWKVGWGVFKYWAEPATEGGFSAGMGQKSPLERI